MPDLPHLILPRAELSLPRKKTGFGSTPKKAYLFHGTTLSGQLDQVLSDFRGRQRPAGINPSLILRVELNEQAGVDEASWERCGLVLLSVDENKTLVLFSSDNDLSDFRRRLSEYQQGPPPDQKGPPHQQIFASIDVIGDVRPQDRIGRLLRLEGVGEPEVFEDQREYVVDVELWDLGDRGTNRGKIDELRTFVESLGGRVSDSYVGESLVLLRLRCDGALIKQLLTVDCVAQVDLPPKPKCTVGEFLNVGIADFPRVLAPKDGAPGVAILDSGVTAGHPMLAPAIGEATTIPRTWPDASDSHGHGTMVAGLALYGDIETCIQSRSFVPKLTLYSARVLNDDCKFDDENLITTQMREAIEYFRQEYGCRVFNISLGDDRLVYQGGKVSAWASILDTLARELDVVIVVSAGNHDFDPGPGNSPDGRLQDYPRYLLEDVARIIAPASGLIVLTVGALARTANVPVGTAGNNVAFRPIAQELQPSPFTRCGPGLGNAIKPELCEFGGNRAYDGVIQNFRNVWELSVVSTNRQYIERLFTTDAGTSMAAPKVAHLAARLYETFPNATANLIRALLASSASVPEPSTRLLQPLGGDAVLRVCGYGQPNLEVARVSNEARVVLYAESNLDLDSFHIYELPIPEEFIANAGTRRITVTLAFDPPVRHSRFDYLGVKMSFRLIRGKSVEEIAEAFRKRSSEEETVDRLTSTTYDCHMEPTPTAREGGTLQRATFTMKRNPSTDFGDTYHVVVRCERKWAREEHSPQRYAVVVVEEHSAAINIYDRIRGRVEETVRIRARQRARG